MIRWFMRWYLKSPMESRYPADAKWSQQIMFQESSGRWKGYWAVQWNRGSVYGTRTDWRTTFHGRTRTRVEKKLAYDRALYEERVAKKVDRSWRTVRD